MTISAPSPRAFERVDARSQLVDRPKVFLVAQRHHRARASPRRRRAVRLERARASRAIDAFAFEHEPRRRSARRRAARASVVHDGVGVPVRRRDFVDAARPVRRVREDEDLARRARAVVVVVVARERGAERAREPGGVGKLVVG